ncbi:unnamed protein product [Cuscuta epithymum]|uniref:Uncharacterized protein n=1 Tax=Cuscuta epithymum TaxID=186058 RepID=A0AAV0DCS1_9ASTE|nr:unnamed protein product [Cuscuta epithymum]
MCVLQSFWRTGTMGKGVALFFHLDDVVSVAIKKESRACQANSQGPSFQAGEVSRAAAATPDHHACPAVRLPQSALIICFPIFYFLIKLNIWYFNDSLLSFL